MAMMYIKEYGKGLTHPHCIKIKGEKVWTLFEINPTPYSHWLKPEVEAWLDGLPRVRKYPWMPLWFPWNPEFPAWKATRPYETLMLKLKSINHQPAGYDQISYAIVRFAHKDDAMTFKLAWA